VFGNEHDSGQDTRFRLLFRSNRHALAGTVIGQLSLESMTTACAAQPRILIADDQPDLLDALRLLLKGQGMAMEAVTSPDAAVASVAGGQFDLLLMDLNYTTDTTSGREGLDLVKRIQAHDSLLPIIVMTGWGSVGLAVESMRGGVQDFIQKPWDNDHLVTTVRTHIEKGRARRDARGLERREQDEALRIQRKLLPATMPAMDGCEISVSWQPASGVGGDCFDAISFTRSRVAISIADVVGKGIPAALLMSNLQAAVRAFATDTTGPANICRQVNRILCGNIAPGRFISFFCCTVDTASGTVTFSSAGHHPPLLVRPDGSMEYLSEGGPVFGIFPDAVYSERQVRFGCGDRLILYTDGITGASPAGEPNGTATPDSEPAVDDFGEKRLVQLTVANRSRSAAELQALLVDAAKAHSGGTFDDDATLIVVAAG
jgi:phosphoserine phosphatase RsbU/P